MIISNEFADVKAELDSRANGPQAQDRGPGHGHHDLPGPAGAPKFGVGSAQKFSAVPGPFLLPLARSGTGLHGGHR